MVDFFDDFIKDLKKEFKEQANTTNEDTGPHAYNPASIRNAQNLRKTREKRRTKHLIEEESVLQIPKRSQRLKGRSGTSKMFNEILEELGDTQSSKKKDPSKPKKSGKGYEYVRDSETGRLRTRAQVEWEKHYNRKVLDHQIVIFRNGNKTDFSKENLVLAYRAGSPLDFLTCKHCGARGQWTIEPIPD